MERPWLYLFDLDGTLISSYMENPNKDYHQWSVLPNVRKRLQELDREGASIDIVSNQAGVGLGFISEADWLRKLKLVREALGIYCLAHVCFAHEKAIEPRYRNPYELRRRKPSGEMIREAVRLRNGQLLYTAFIGDHKTDREAARDAGIGFFWAKDFFKWEDK